MAKVLVVALLLLGNAFFVAGEFALIAARRTVVEPMAGWSKRARLALDMFAGRAAAGIAAAATTLPRLDALVFTGGIGEHSASMRSAIVGRLGVAKLQPLVMRDVRSDAVLSGPDTDVAVLRIEAREDAVVAGQADQLLSSRRKT